MHIIGGSSVVVPWLPYICIATNPRSRQPPNYGGAERDEGHRRIGTPLGNITEPTPTEEKVGEGKVARNGTAHQPHRPSLSATR